MLSPLYFALACILKAKLQDNLEISRVFKHIAHELFLLRKKSFQTNEINRDMVL